MGIDFYDVLSGVGDGMQKYAGIKREDKKAELAQKLELEREQRAEQYAINREGRAEARERAKPASTEIIPGDEGTFFKVVKNSFGDVLEKSLANPLDIEKINQEREKGRATLEQTLAATESARANTEQTRAETSFLPTKQGLERRLTESMIGENDAQAQKARNPPKKDDSEEADLLRQARERLKQPGVTAEMVAAYLTRKGYPELAKKLYLPPKDE